jgi:hypothetical protein
MGLVYGIDFGTSNSAIMVGRPVHRVIPIGNPFESSAEIPTVVCMRPDGTMAVGSIARRMKLQRPAWFRDEFKREVGRETPITFPPERRGDPYGGRSFPVYRLVAEILQTLRLQAEKKVPGRPDAIVITVPASWEAVSRGQISQAATFAGFDGSSVHLVTEPEAAAAYAVQEHLGMEERTLLIYDLGGGTFDCAVVRGKGRLGFEVLGEPGGLDNVGGTLFDRRILGLICERFPAETSRILDVAEPDNQILARQLQLRDTCENAKRVLSAEDRYEGLLIELTEPGSFRSDIEFVLTRDQLARIVDPILAETIAECERMLSSIGLTWGDIDGVIPIGGSTRLPMVGDAIARRCAPAGTSVMRVDDPELAVVHGAVLHGFALQQARTAPLVPTPAGAPPRSAAPPAYVPPAATEPLAGRQPAAASDPPGAEIEATAGPQPAAAANPDYALWPAADDTPDDGKARPAGSQALRDSDGNASPDSAAGPDPGSQSFYAKNAGKARSARLIVRRGIYLAAVAALLAILNIFDVVSNTNSHRGVTSGEMALGSYGLALAAAVILALGARAMHRRLVAGAGAAITLAIAIACTAGIHYILGGWPGTLLVALSSITAGLAFVMFLVEGESILTSLTLDDSGMTLSFHGSLKSISWSDVESITVPDGSGKVRVKLTAAGARRSWYPLTLNSANRTLEIFSRYYFTVSDRTVYTANNSHSGRELVSGYSLSSPQA